MNCRTESRHFFILSLFLVFFSNLACLSGRQALAQVKKDTTIILISDLTMQIETTQALNDLYNFKFEKAEQLKTEFRTVTVVVNPLTAEAASYEGLRELPRQREAHEFH